MSPDPTEQQRKLYIKVMFYKFTAMAMAIVGLVIFLVLYYQLTNGNVMEVVRNPTYLIILLFPFIPAVILSWIMTRVQNKLERNLEKSK